MDISLLWNPFVLFVSSRCFWKKDDHRGPVELHAQTDAPIHTYESEGRLHPWRRKKGESAEVFCRGFLFRLFMRGGLCFVFVQVL